MIPRGLRIIFMGTPGFAVPCLQYLLEAGYPIVGVVTAPDKPGGRGLKQMISSPVKQFAQSHHLPLFQPASLKSKSFLSELRGLNADLQVVVAFRMLPEVVWGMPPQGTINLHGSLLPAYRGAAPIQWAIIRGETRTGVTTFQMQHEIDTGAILFQRDIPILEGDDAGTLHDRMMHVGAGLILATVDQLCLGPIPALKQDQASASHAPKLHHADGMISWNQPVRMIYNLIRGLSPFPGAYTHAEGTEWKILKSRIHSHDVKTTPGIIAVQDKKLLIQTGDGQLEILEAQLAGKRRMSARELINGYPVRDWLLT